MPDLRRSAALEDAQTWRMIVHEGALRENGMVSFAPVMSATEADTIRHYVIRRAHEDIALEAQR